MLYVILPLTFCFFFFFFNDTATTEIYTLSLHDALPICTRRIVAFLEEHSAVEKVIYPELPSHPDYELCRKLLPKGAGAVLDRKSTRLNSSHLVISYAVFCLKKKKDEPCRERYNPYSGTA